MRIIQFGKDDVVVINQDLSMEDYKTCFGGDYYNRIRKLTLGWVIDVIYELDECVLWLDDYGTWIRVNIKYLDMMFNNNLNKRGCR